MKTLLLRFFTHRHQPIILGIVGLCLALPALFGGLSSDDYLIRAVTRGDHLHPQMNQALRDMFQLVPGPEMDHTVLRERGVLPWYAHPEIRLAFSRPIPSLTLWLDSQLWMDQIVLWHLHSLLWFGLSIWVVGLVFREIHGKTSCVAGLALLLFAVEDARAANAAWLSDRAAAMVLIPAGFALIHYIRLRREGHRNHGVKALMWYGLTLLTKEAALGIFAFFFAWEVCISKDALKTRILNLAPFVGLTLIWRMAYNAMGYGATASGLYVDPGRDLVAFGSALVTNGPLLLFGQWLQGPVDFWLAFSPQTQQTVWMVVVVMLIILTLLFIKLLRHHETARFYAVAMMVGVVPLCAGIPTERVLAFLGLSAFGMLALEAERIGWLDQAAVGGRSFLHLLTGLLLFIHVMGAILLPLKVAGFPLLNAMFTLAPDQLPDDPKLAEQTVVFVNGDDLVMHLPFIRLERGQSVPAKTAVLGLLSAKSSVTRAGEKALRIDVENGWLYRQGHRFFNDMSRPFTVGQSIRGAGFQAEILAVTEDHRPRSVSFQFDLPLEDPAYVWYCWRKGQMQPFTPPGVNETIQLPMTMPGWNPGELQKD